MKIKVPINGLKDKGANKITVTINADNKVDELFINNNSATKDIFIYEDEVKPVYPFDLSIVNKQNVKLTASTADALSKVSDYVVEMDTTKLFNSSMKFSKTVTSKGGIIEVQPVVSLKDSTVYYWRISKAFEDGSFHWNTALFIFINNGEEGFNQSHLFQHLNSGTNRISLDSANHWGFGNVVNNIFIKHGVWGGAATVESDVVVNVNAESYIRNTCTFGIIFNVFDQTTFKPWKNEAINGKGLFESVAPCNPTRMYNFEFTNDSSGRRKATAFLKQIPAGDYVVLRNQMYTTESKNQYVQNWINDETIYGAGNSLYANLKSRGITIIDSIYKPRVFAAAFKNKTSTFKVKQTASNGIYDNISLSVDISTPDSIGYITSPLIGPAKVWGSFSWKGIAKDTSDKAEVDVIGIDVAGKETSLLHSTIYNQKTDISTIDANIYPFLKLKLIDKDAVKHTPYQLKGWSVIYKPVPEGAIAPNIFIAGKDTLNLGEPLDFKVAFKNVSTTPFDSLKVKIVITDQSNVQHVLPVVKLKPINGNDTLHVRQLIDTKNLTGLNTLYIEVNPDNDQPEQYNFNNFLYRKIFIKGDETNPVMDVTFDNIHILNNDLVSSKPDILIMLKDDATGQMLDDSSLVKVQVRFPDGNLKTFNYNTDTLQFEPANNVSGEGNVATARFKPQFLEDGNYELIVTAKDKAGNKAGNTDYRVGFQVITKAMISNMLNYPNPFTTSTAFVFTLTGSEVPQNIKIQILTITGKIVREITKEELGNLKIGRNITDFKWDGTDQFGQKLGNGVYLYRVVTNLNGRNLEKYKSESDNTDQYFNKGYGKMYLMR